MPAQVQSSQSESTSGILFDPLHPREFKEQKQGRSLIVRAVAGRFVAIVQKGNIARSISLPSDFVQANAVKLADATAIVLGMVNGSVSKVIIIDLDRAVIKDEFLALDPSVSPDGRFIAFVKFYPTHFVQGVEDHYMLYDTKLDAARNRPSAVSVHDPGTVGVAVFPFGVGNRPGDNTEVKSRATHHLASESFFWQDDGASYILLDHFENRYTIVRVRLQDADRMSVSTLPLERGPLCGDKPISCSLLLKGSTHDSASKSTTLLIRGINDTVGLKKSLTVADDAFSQIGTASLR
jgi:hypothetical protein